MKPVPTPDGEPFVPTAEQLMSMRFPAVLAVTEDGLTVVAASVNLILWLKDGRVKQTWMRYPCST